MPVAQVAWSQGWRLEVEGGGALDSRLDPTQASTQHRPFLSCPPCSAMRAEADGKCATFKIPHTSLKLLTRPRNRVSSI